MTNKKNYFGFYFSFCSNCKKKMGNFCPLFFSYPKQTTLLRKITSSQLHTNDLSQFTYEMNLDVKTYANMTKKYIFCQILDDNNNVIQLAKNKLDGSYVVIKRISKKDEYLNEMSILKIIQKDCKKNNCLQMLDIFESSSYIYIVTEYIQGLDLINYTLNSNGRIPEKTCAFVIKNIAIALNYLHKNNIIHRDIKPDNVMIIDNKTAYDVKLIDFGLSTFCHKNLRGAIGSEWYIAPEMINSDSYDFMVDNWSLGVLMYTCLCGYLPFYSNINREVLFLTICTGKILFQPDDIWNKISYKAKDLISKLIVVNPKRRYTAAQVLTHEWIIEQTSSV